MQANLLKAQLGSGEPTFVFSVRMARTVNIVSLAQAAGYHGFYVDLQHSSISVDTAAQIFTTALHQRRHRLRPSAQPRTRPDLATAGCRGAGHPGARHPLRR